MVLSALEHAGTELELPSLVDLIGALYLEEKWEVMEPSSPAPPRGCLGPGLAQHKHHVPTHVFQKPV